MERQIEPSAAWLDFWNWIREAERWRPLTRPQKHYLYKAQYAHNAGKLGPERTRRLLGVYAPERYTFRDVVIVHE